MVRFGVIGSEVYVTVEIQNADGTTAPLPEVVRDDVAWIRAEPTRNYIIRIRCQYQERVAAAVWIDGIRVCTRAYWVYPNADTVVSGFPIGLDPTARTPFQFQRVQVSSEQAASQTVPPFDSKLGSIVVALYRVTNVSPYDLTETTLSEWSPLATSMKESLWTGAVTRRSAFADHKIIVSKITTEIDKKNPLAVAKFHYRDDTALLLNGFKDLAVFRRPSAVPPMVHKTEAAPWSHWQGIKTKAGTEPQLKTEAVPAPELKTEAVPAPELKTEAAPPKSELNVGPGPGVMMTRLAAKRKAVQGGEGGETTTKKRRIVEDDEEV
jgi:hypothetical protein